VCCDALQLAHDHANILSALGHLDPGQLLQRQGIRQIGGHRRQVVEPVGEDDVLEVGARLAELLDRAVQVAHHGARGDDSLAVEREDEAEHAVGAGVLRPHVDGEQLPFLRALLGGGKWDRLRHSGPLRLARSIIPQPL